MLIGPRNRYQAKPDIVVVAGRGDPVAIRGASVVSDVTPRTAAQHPNVSICSANPRRAVSGSVTVTIVINVLAPLPNIPQHIV